MSGLLILLVVAAILLVAMLTAMLAWEMVHPPRHTAAYAVARSLACDPAELNLRFDSWTLDRPDGDRLAVWDVQSSNRDVPGNPPSIAVLLHGWGHSRIDSLARIDTFLTMFDRVVLYDLRGHGESSGTARLGCGEADDLIALLEQVGDARVVLIGHSMGAVIAIKAAALAGASPDPGSMIAGVIAYGPYCEFHPSLRGRLKVAGYPARPLTDLALLLHRLRGIVPLSLSERDTRQLRCPLLVIHGGNDAVAPPSHGRRLATAAPNGTFIEIADSGHVDAHRTNDPVHDQAVRAFVRECMASSPKAGSLAACEDVSPALNM